MTAAPCRPLPPLRDVIAAHGLSASRALGQNFLFDEQLLDRIAAIPGRLDGARIFEVGPGPGGLTRALLRAGARVTAVERDARCLPALAELADAFPGKLDIVQGDALQVDPRTLVGEGDRSQPGEARDSPRPPIAHIVSNLPYNVGTALLVGWLSTGPWPPWWASLTLMFQLEVAERIVASAGSDAYGRLAVLAQWRSTPRIAMKVHRSAFTPPPKVMSAVVHIVPDIAPPGVEMKRLEQLTAAAFGQRRKMLRQSLKNVPGALAALEKLEIDSARRAETIAVADWVKIARMLSAPAT